jgi:hypothetical protein
MCYERYLGINLTRGVGDIGGLPATEPHKVRRQDIVTRLHPLFGSNLEVGVDASNGNDFGLGFHFAGAARRVSLDSDLTIPIYLGSKQIKGGKSVCLNDGASV